MEIPLAFGLSLAENGWIVVQCDAYESHASTRLFPTKQKLFEFLQARMEDYEAEYDDMIEEYDQPKRDVDPGEGFSEDSELPQCLNDVEIYEDVKESDNEYEEYKKAGKLERPKKPVKSSEPVKMDKAPWWKIWAKN